MRYKSKILLLILIVVAFSCNKNSTKSSNVKAENTPDEVQELTVTERVEVIRYSSTGCRGECPVLDLTLFSDGYATLDAKKFVRDGELTGEYSSQLGKSNVDELINKLEPVYGSLEENYRSNRSDQATSIVKYNDKTVKFYGPAPEELKSIIKDIRDIVNTAQWQQTN